MRIHWVHPWNLIKEFKESDVPSLQCRRAFVHLSGETMWFIYKDFYGCHLCEMTYEYKLIDIVPDAFDVSKMVANTFYCGV